jgi:hypothetical protein
MEKRRIYAYALTPAFSYINKRSIL